MTRIRRIPTGAMIVYAVLVLTMAFATAATLPVEAQTATPAPPHESPKSPKGNEGTTAIIAVIAVALVGGGIAGGRAIELRHLAAPAPGAVVRGDEANDASARHEESPAP